jgi:hypothetical protein
MRDSRSRAEADSALGVVATEPGPYCQRGKRLDYQIELVLNQTAPLSYKPSTTWNRVLRG